MLAEQIAAIDPERLSHLVGHLSQPEMADVDHALQVVSSTALNNHRDHSHQQYLSDSKNPRGYCNHGPNGLTCPVGVARVPSDLH